MQFCFTHRHLGGGLTLALLMVRLAKKTTADATIEANNNMITGGCPVLEGTKWAANLVSRSSVSKPAAKIFTYERSQWIWNGPRWGQPGAPRKTCKKKGEEG